MLISSSKLALRKISKLLKCLAKAAAVDSPTSGMPNELIKISKVGLVAASMLVNRLSIDFSPKPSRLLSLDSYCLSLNKSATWLTNPRLMRLSFILYPRPSIFIAFLETKCSKYPNNCAGQLIPASHFMKGPSVFKVVPHEGHWLGIFTSVSDPSLTSTLTFVI